MKDTDFLTASTRIRAMEKNLMDKDRASRMLEARSDDEIIKILTECGYGEMQSLTAAELDRVLDRARDGLYDLILSMTDQTGLLDVFRTGYDYHNAKVLIKNESAPESVSRLLVPAGRVPLRTLQAAFNERAFSALPPMLSSAIMEARELLARTGDPQRSDILLDHACLAEMLSLAQGAESAYLLSYVRLYIDVQNLRAVVRAKRLGKEADFLRLFLAPGGTVEPFRILTFLTGGGSIADLHAQGSLSEAAAAGQTAARGETAMTHFEKLCDDALIQKSLESRYVSFGEQPLVGYIIRREAEMTLLRTIITGRLAGVPSERLRERLRAVYT